MSHEKASSEQETARVREAVRNAYNYIFYGMDSELENFLFGYRNKNDVIKIYPGLRSIFLEGEPSIFPVDSPKPGHGEVPKVEHGGPLGYEILLTFWNPSLKRVKKGEVFTYTVYHNGAGFVEEGICEVKPFKGAGLYHDEYGQERPLETRDTQSLSALLNLIQSAYRIVDSRVQVAS